MKFLTREEAVYLAARFLGDDGLPVLGAPDRSTRDVVFEKAPGYTYLAHAREVVAALDHFDWCLLWVVQTQVWPSNENLHLYYRFRGSYAERSHVEDKPAILALQHEGVDLVSFVHLGMLYGWEMYLVTSHDYGRAFISHDGYFRLSVVGSSQVGTTANGADLGPAT
jgi:hypothetical protein